MKVSSFAGGGCGSRISQLPVFPAEEPGGGFRGARACGKHRDRSLQVLSPLPNPFLSSPLMQHCAQSGGLTIIGP